MTVKDFVEKTLKEIRDGAGGPVEVHLQFQVVTNSEHALIVDQMGASVSFSVETT